MLNGQVVVVTGGCGLLGTEFVDSILKNDGRAVIADLDADKGQQLVERFAEIYGPGRVLFSNMDICSESSLNESIRNIINQFDRIDALVNNAYPRNQNYGRKLEDVTYEDFCENVSLNLGGLFLSSKCFARHFKQQGFGNIINIASIYGVVAPRFEVYQGTQMTMPVEYAAIKSAVIHLTKYFAKYFQGHDIRINSISPGGIANNQHESFLSNYKKFAINKGMLDARDISGTLLYLLSDMSLFVNGQNIVVDDGWSL